MRIAKTSTRFRKDYKKAKRSGNRNMKNIENVMNKLIDGEILEQKYCDHELWGKWKWFRDCHIEWDWVLIYELWEDDNWNEIITFHATDNHANLFDHG